MTNVIRVNVPGYQGPKGDTGDAGASATIEIGTVTTLGSTEPAAVTNAGSGSAAILDFGIPQGEQGIPGDVQTVNSVAPSSGDVVLSASDIPFTPPEGMTATDVQSAIEELLALVST